MKKVNVTKEEMASAVKANGKEPWVVLGMSRRTWFRSLSKNCVTMDELQSQYTETNTETETETETNIETNIETEVSEVPVRTIRPVPQWSPEVTREANAVGRGGVRYKYTDINKYNEWKKEDDWRLIEASLKNEVTHKPAERIVKPDNIPEELLQYDQTDVPYDVWTKYIDESKGEHWGTFVMKYGRFLEPKKHNTKEEVEKRTSEKLGIEYFEKYLGKGGKYNPTRDSYIWKGEECFF